MFLSSFGIYSYLFLFLTHHTIHFSSSIYCHIEENLSREMTLKWRWRKLPYFCHHLQKPMKRWTLKLFFKCWDSRKESGMPQTLPLTHFLIHFCGKNKRKFHKISFTGHPTQSFVSIFGIFMTLAFIHIN